jgi:hypothetical protein
LKKTLAQGVGGTVTMVAVDANTGNNLGSLHSSGKVLSWGFLSMISGYYFLEIVVRDCPN